jgi:uncharacterized low-complexity protein
MSDKPVLKPLAIAVGTAIVTSLASVNAATAAENPFAMTELSSGYMVAEMAEGKCGGATKTTEEGKCGEGKCGGATKTTEEGKCGEGKCGGAKATSAATAEGGEGGGDEGGEGGGDEGGEGGGDEAAGAAKTMTEGKCGEGKCGGAKPTGEAPE